MFPVRINRLALAVICVLAGLACMIGLYNPMASSSNSSTPTAEFITAEVERKLTEGLVIQEAMLQMRLDDAWDHFSSELEVYRQLERTQAENRRKRLEKRRRANAVLEPLYREMVKHDEYMMRNVELTQLQGFEPPPKVLIVSGCDKHTREANITRFKEMETNRKRYAKRHNHRYQFIDLDRIASEDYGWGRLPALSKAFDENPNVDWIWWLDVDALIMNHDVDLAEHLLHPRVMQERIAWGRPVMNPDHLFVKRAPTAHQTLVKDIDVLLTHDRHGWNQGSMFLRRSEFTSYLLDVWNDQALKDQGFHEQDALTQQALNHPTIFRRIGTCPQRLFNAYYDRDAAYKQGDFVVRFTDGVDAAVWSRFYDFSRVAGQPYSGSGIPPKVQMEYERRPRTALA